ncbi:MAG: hypothetical protein NZ890_04145, partial [Myxococcota bacterium]|nr:hypothetical protein [Myxococcota bacterium]
MRGFIGASGTIETISETISARGHLDPGGGQARGQAPAQLTRRGPPGRRAGPQRPAPVPVQQPQRRGQRLGLGRQRPPRLPQRPGRPRLSPLVAQPLQHLDRLRHRPALLAQVAIAA